MLIFELLEKVACQAQGHPGYEVMVAENGWILQVCEPCGRIDIYVDGDVGPDEVMVYLSEHFPEFVG